jgi:hypothetical protein
LKMPVEKMHVHPRNLIFYLEMDNCKKHARS